MKITIDTKEDSHHEIRKVITLLKHLIGEQAHSPYDSQHNYESPNNHSQESPTKNIFEDSSTSSVGAGLFGMFGTPESSSEPTHAPLPTTDALLQQESTKHVPQEVEQKEEIQFYGL